MKAPSGRTLRIAAASIALIGLSGGALTSMTSGAVFTDSRAVSPTTVTTGTVALSLGASTIATLGSTANAPGDSHYALISVSNTGTLAVRYSATVIWSTANLLTRAMLFSVIEVATASSPCDDTLSWTSAPDGTNVLAADVKVSTGTSAPLFGSTAAGQQAGDRPVDADGIEHLCVRELEPSTYSTNTALTASVSLRFDAEQSANN